MPEQGVLGYIASILVSFSSFPLPPSSDFPGGGRYLLLWKGRRNSLDVEREGNTFFFFSLRLGEYLLGPLVQLNRFLIQLSSTSSQFCEMIVSFSLFHLILPADTLPNIAVFQDTLIYRTTGSRMSIHDSSIDSLLLVIIHPKGSSSRLCSSLLDCVHTRRFAPQKSVLRD